MSGVKKRVVFELRDGLSGYVRGCGVGFGQFGDGSVEDGEERGLVCFPEFGREIVAGDVATAAVEDYAWFYWGGFF